MKNFKTTIMAFFVVFIAFAIFPSIAHADTNRIQFTDHLGLILFDGKINGVEGTFLLDTGADNSLINSRVAKEMNLKELKGMFGMLGMGGISQFNVDNFQIGEWYFEDRNIFGIDLAIVEQYLGLELLAIVGGDFLSGYVLTVDYQNEVFYLSDETPQISDNATIVPMKISDNLVFIKARTIADGPEYAYLVDTGATATLYFKNRLEECCPEYSSWKASLGWLEATFMGKLKADLYEMPEFHVGDLGIEPMVIVTSDAGLLGLSLNLLAGEPLHGVVGYTFLKFFKVTFDYPHRRFILEPYEHYQERFPNMFNSVGFMVSYKNGSPVIDHILPSTPAESSGVQIGDKLLEIDGVDVTLLDSLQLSMMEMGDVGTEIKMLLERDGKRFFVTLKRVHLFK